MKGKYIVDGGRGCGNLTYKMQREKRILKEAIRPTRTSLQLAVSFSSDGTNGLLSWGYEVQNSSCPLEMKPHSPPKSELRFVSTIPDFRIRGKLAVRSLVQAEGTKREGVSTIAHSLYKMSLLLKVLGKVICLSTMQWRLLKVKIYAFSPLNLEEVSCQSQAVPLYTQDKSSSQQLALKCSGYSGEKSLSSHGNHTTLLQSTVSVPPVYCIEKKR